VPARFASIEREGVAPVAAWHQIMGMASPKADLDPELAAMQEALAKLPEDERKARNKAMHDFVVSLPQRSASKSPLDMLAAVLRPKGIPAPLK
jgi:hypothetical protein